MLSRSSISTLEIESAKTRVLRLEGIVTSSYSINTGNFPSKSQSIFSYSKYKYYEQKPFNMSKLITVFGASGNQGGSVIRHILADSKLSKEFRIRGITRDTKKPASQDLARQGVEVVSVS